jgi:hypothetical protein
LEICHRSEGANRREPHDHADDGEERAVLRLQTPDALEAQAGADGSLEVSKHLSDRVDLAALGAGAADVRRGTTIATNALLERKGVPVLLVVTRGFGVTCPQLTEVVILRVTAPTKARPASPSARLKPTVRSVSIKSTSYFPLARCISASTRHRNALGVARLR